MWKGTCFLLLLCLLDISVQEESNETSCDIYTIVSSITQENCTKGTYLLQNYEGCLPKCVPLPDIPPEDPFYCDALPCPPGYKCVDGDVDGKICLLDEESCLIYHVKYRDESQPYLDAKFRPVCDKDGKWNAKQLKGEEVNGRYFCFDEVGNRIYGHAWSDDADDMTCACSRKSAELAKDPDNWFVSLHCDEMGNYEKLQCSPDHCWCAEPKTGEITAPVVPQSLMTYLPCYNRTTIGSQYLRQCESFLFAQSKLKREAYIHGTTKVNIDMKLCDGDGSFGSYDQQEGNIWCTWKDNSRIEPFQTPLGEANDQINCRCARDKNYYDKGTTLACKGNGNYEPLQKQGKFAYCVDEDGFAKSDLLNGTDAENKAKCNELK